MLGEGGVGGREVAGEVLAELLDFMEDEEDPFATTCAKDLPRWKGVYGFTFSSPELPGACQVAGSFRLRVTTCHAPSAMGSPGEDILSPVLVAWGPYESPLLSPFRSSFFE